MTTPQPKPASFQQNNNNNHNNASHNNNNNSNKTDYYASKNLNTILWNKDWFQDMFQLGNWCSGSNNHNTTNPSMRIRPINPMFDSYHPYTCNTCKRGPLTHNTPLKQCSKCRVVKYCCKEHQAYDWKTKENHIGGHQVWCNAFCQAKENIERKAKESGNFPIKMSNLEEFRTYSKYLTNEISQCMKVNNNNHGRQPPQDLPLHSSLVQIGVMQPRCRRCYRTGADGADLVVCPRCAGVALCRSCLKARPPPYNRFHYKPKEDSNSSPGGIEECDSYLLSLACDGMVVEQGTPLAIESDTDCNSYFLPRDWIQYFQRKGTDFSFIPRGILQMAPVVAFLTDGLSIPLTIQHTLARVLPNSGTLTKLVIHLVGASVHEEFSVTKYIELLRINPSLQYLRIVMIGPQLEQHPLHVHNNGPQFPPEGLVLNFTSPKNSPIRYTCDAKVQRRQGYYHQVAPTLQRPDLIVAVHSGLHDEEVYTSQWRPSIDYMIQNPHAVPCVFTGWNHSEILKDTKVLETIGANIIVPPTPNPFRGLRPFLDPLRDPSDFIYSNASFVIFRGGNPATTSISIDSSPKLKKKKKKQTKTPKLKPKKQKHQHEHTQKQSTTTHTTTTTTMTHK